LLENKFNSLSVRRNMDDDITIRFEYKSKKFDRMVPERYEEKVKSFRDFIQHHENDTKYISFLFISGKKTESIEYTDKLSRLINLEIDSVKLKVVDLNQFEKLLKIRLFKCGLDAIPYLINPAVHHLDLMLNKITKIENLDTNLCKLFLCGNQITKIENLEKVNPIYLDLSANRIFKIENLDGLGFLGRLDLSTNRIFKLENLDKLLYSKILLFNNKICSTKGVRLNEGIKLLNLNDNPILNFSFENVKDVEIRLDRTYIFKLNLHLMKDIVGFNQYYTRDEYYGLNEVDDDYVLSENFKTTFKETLI
jgi:hypothetical protein